MADMLPVVVPEEFTRRGNTDHRGKKAPIEDSKHFAYGTAGFRYEASILPFVVYRLGYLAALRARELNKTIGIMITASHNPACDNGAKIVDPMGEMLAGEWEMYASELVNVSDDQLPTAIRALEVQILASDKPSDKARVVCGRDTRDSGEYLAEAAKQGVALMGVEFGQLGVLTTPQLHYIVRCENDPSFGKPTEEGYYTKLSAAFKELVEITPSTNKSESILYLDCANGVGADKMRLMESYLPKGIVTINSRNENGPLNEHCGADFVKISQVLPSHFDDVTPEMRCASLDGDADRLVYFRRAGPETKKLVVLDGDRIAVLICKYIKEQLIAAGIEDQLTLGIVQTAYANGNSTKYIREVVGATSVFVPTGVKHLHHAAVNYDIGIYFEANGHGTVVFSKKFRDTVDSVKSENLALRRLQLISTVINEVVGDAISDMLAVEVILRHFGWSIEDWEQNLYTDAANIQIKVPVKDRSIYKTTFEETTLLQPAGVQDKIDALVSQYSAARAFVRPSGTENIVRVYAEADAEDSAKELGGKISELVKQLSV